MGCEHYIEPTPKFNRNCLNLTVTIICGFTITMHHYIDSLLWHIDFFVVWRHSIWHMHVQFQFPAKCHHLNYASLRFITRWCSSWTILTHWGRGHLNCLNARSRGFNNFNPLNAELNTICYLLALLAHHFSHVSRIRVKSLTLRLLLSYINEAPILDVSRSHTTTQHSR